MSDTAAQHPDDATHAHAQGGARSQDAPQDIAPGVPPTAEGGQPERARLLHGRLHPSVIALWTVRSFAPLVAVLIASSPERVIAVAAVAVTLVASWVRWARFRWRIDTDQLVIERGLLQHTRRVIPIERIQAVQAERKIRHRIFGVVGLRIETVGGDESEGQLDALRPQTAVAVQRALLRSPAAAQAPSAVPADAVLVRCTPQMLFVAGLTGGRVGVVAAFLAFGQEIAGERVADTVLAAPDRFGVTAIVLALLIGAVIAFVLSVAVTMLTYWDFTVMRTDDLLRLHRGLLAERRDTVPLARVQSLTVEENLARRLLGMAAVKMVVAGRAGQDEALTSTLLPIASRPEAFALAATVLDVGGLGAVELRPMPRAARSRRLLRAALVVVALTVVTWLLASGPWRAGGLTAGVLTVPAALAAYRSLGWHADDRVITARSGWLVRRTTITPVQAPQSVRVSMSPFQRRRDLATMHVDIARSRGARDPRLIDMARADAERLQRALADSPPAELQMAPHAT